MIPKIDYQTKELLTQIFLSPFVKKKEFHKDVKEFVKQFKKIEKDILISIEKCSGFKWSKKRIPVYLIPPNGHTFSFTRGELEKNTSGVVQKLYVDFELTTDILIHELTHVNQFQSDFRSKKNKFAFPRGKRNSNKIEICSDVVTFYVIREIFGENSSYEKRYWKFNNKEKTSSPGVEKELPKYMKKFDLDKKTLKEYIFK